MEQVRGGERGKRKGGEKGKRKGGVRNYKNKKMKLKKGGERIE